jgi:hypothetical protein
MAHERTGESERVCEQSEHPLRGVFAMFARTPRTLAKRPGPFSRTATSITCTRLMPAAATANRNAVLTVEGIKLEVLAGQAAGRQLKLDEVREIPLIHR